jgi:hypothetical protein
MKFAHFCSHFDSPLGGLAFAAELVYDMLVLPVSYGLVSRNSLSRGSCSLPADSRSSDHGLYGLSWYRRSDRLEEGRTLPCRRGAARWLRVPKHPAGVSLLAGVSRKLIELTEWSERPFQRLRRSYFAAGMNSSFVDFPAPPPPGSTKGYSVDGSAKLLSESQSLMNREAMRTVSEPAAGSSLK